MAGDDEDWPYGDILEESIHLFVLDVSSWSGRRDQSFADGYVTDFGDDGSHPSPPHSPPSLPSSSDPKSRLEAQVACMKLIACARQPRQVGVVHMGGYTSRVRVDVEPTENWRVKPKSGLGEEGEAAQAEGDNAAGVLVDYAPSSEARESSVACPDPWRIVVALRKCKEQLSGIFTERRKCNARGSVIVTLFLSSPPKGLTLLESDLQAVVREVRGAPHNASVQLVLHPQVFSAEYLSKLGSGVWSSYDTSSDFAPETRCSEQDMEIIERCFGVSLRHQIPDPNILYTVCQSNDQYLSPWCLEKVDMYERWKECYARGDDFPQLLWGCEWLPVYFEDWLGRQTGGIAEEFEREMEEGDRRDKASSTEEDTTPDTPSTAAFTAEQTKKMEMLIGLGFPEEWAEKCAAADADGYEVVPTNEVSIQTKVKVKEGADVNELRKHLKALADLMGASKGVTHANYTLSDGEVGGLEVYNSPDAMAIGIGTVWPHYVKAVPYMDMTTANAICTCNSEEMEFYREYIPGSLVSAWNIKVKSSL